MKNKHCGKCNTVLPITEFGSDSSKASGVHSNCRACCRESARARYKKNKESNLTRKKIYYLENREEKLDDAKTYYQNNKAKVLDYQIDYRDKNRDRIRESNRAYYKKNKHVHVEKSNRRRAQKLSATPGWVNLKVVKEIYRVAQEVSDNTNIPHQVDHVVPLVSPVVCGLHCEDNLQVIPAEENLAKSNKWPLAA